MSFYLIKAICPAHKKIINLSFLAIIVLSLFSYEVLAENHDASVKHGASANHGVSGSDKYDKDKALKFSQAAINRIIGSYQFTGGDKKVVDIAQYRGKPLIISLIYTSCHHICPTLTSHLADVVDIAREALGEESFSVVTIGFDTAVDSPERMRLFARERYINLSSWGFLSTDEETIKALSNDLGFIFFKSAKGFDHLSQVSLLDADGKVYRQIYGVEYEPPILVEPLKELIFGKRTEANIVDGWINNIRLFCTLYDPLSGRYKFDYSIFIGIGVGLFVLGSIAVFIVREWRRNNKINGAS